MKTIEDIKSNWESVINQVVCAEAIEFMSYIPDKTISMILCDLPYGTTTCKWDIVIPFELLWKQYERIIKDNSAIVLTASQPFTSLLVASNINLFKYEWVWCKSRALGFAHTKNAPMKKHENVLVFSKANIKHLGQPNRMNYFPQNLTPYGKEVDGNKQCKADTNGHKFARPSNKVYVQEFTNYPVSLLNFNNEGNTQHPTQKPIALFEYLIKTYTNEGDLVLDNAAGSFTTAVAATNLKRDWICCDSCIEYCNVGEKRLKEV